MRILIDIDGAQVEALSELARRRRRSRAALIRTAVETYLAAQVDREIKDGFGLWSDLREDGLEYQERLRKEW